MLQMTKVNDDSTVICHHHLESIAPIKSEYLITTDSIDCQPKQRQRGMNKNRRAITKKSDGINWHKRLCPSVIDELNQRECRLGDKCQFEHSIERYQREKPADIADRCPIFDLRGECPFSITCRFANAHKSSTDQSIIDQSWKQSLNPCTVDLQRQLRKKQYDFTRSECAIIANDESKIGAVPIEKESKIGAVPIEKEPKIGAVPIENEPKIGAVPMENERRRVPIDWLHRPYLAPLTTVGNLPFRRLCIGLGAEITCGEMALATNILQASPSEWSLLRRHPSERVFGVQLAGGYIDSMTRAAQVVVDNVDVDFIDINLGCPIDLVNQKGAGCALANRPSKLIPIIGAMKHVLSTSNRHRDNVSIPLTIKIRTGIKEGHYTAHTLIEKLVDASIQPDLITLHPRSKEQRYTKLADWQYVSQCAIAADPIPMYACGDVLSYEDYYRRIDECPIGGVMIARGALIKPWLFTEINERRHWDISATERIDIIQRFVNYGLEHWGSDDKGVCSTRRFLLEWLSFQHRYIPVGLLDVLPQKMNQKPPAFRGRNEMETLLSSDRASDWIKISEMFLGRVDDEFVFVPKHKANAY